MLSYEGVVTVVLNKYIGTYIRSMYVHMVHGTYTVHTYMSSIVYHGLLGKLQ